MKHVLFCFSGAICGIAYTSRIESSEPRRRTENITIKTDIPLIIFHTNQITIRHSGGHTGGACGARHQGPRCPRGPVAEKVKKIVYLTM